MTTVKGGERRVLVHGNKLGGEGGVFCLRDRVGGRVGGMLRQDLIRRVSNWTAACNTWSLRFLP